MASISFSILLHCKSLKKLKLSMPAGLPLLSKNNSFCCNSLYSSRFFGNACLIANAQSAFIPFHKPISGSLNCNKLTRYSSSVALLSKHLSITVAITSRIEVCSFAFVNGFSLIFLHSKLKTNSFPYSEKVSLSYPFDPKI